MSGYELEYTPATMCYNAEHLTNFAELNMDQMKAMVSASSPTEVQNVAKGWADVYTKLVGGEASSGSGGNGGIKKLFTTAVDEVLENWEGEAANQFKTQAKKIAKKIKDGAEYARYTSIAMKSAGDVLERLKPEIEGMEKPGKGSSAVDFVSDMGSRSDEGLRNDLARGDMTTEQALNNNRGDLSKGKEAQLEMAIKMEQLGAAYVSQTKSMGSWQRRDKRDGTEDYPGEPGGTAPVPTVLPESQTPPNTTGPASLKGMEQGPGTNSNINAPKTDGIIGGNQQSPVNTQSQSSTSQIGTGLNGISGGQPSGGTNLGGGGTNTLGSGPGTIGGSGNTGPTGMPGPVGALGGNGGRGGGSGSGARGMGRPGMGGTPGMNQAGKNSKGRGKSSLAKTRGGVVGAAKGKAGGKGQGGSGLHRSRGGTMAGRPPGSRHTEEEEKSGKKRPDYLVEDEETWAPEGNVAPKVVE